jgi:hypothetical protein
MIVATFGPTTGWAGRTITYDEGRLSLQDFGPITAQAVLEYDLQGYLQWTDGRMKQWVSGLAAPAVTAGPLDPPAGPRTPAKAPEGAGRRRRALGLPVWAWVLIVAGVAAAVVAFQVQRIGGDGGVAVVQYHYTAGGHRVLAGKGEGSLVTYGPFTLSARPQWFSAFGEKLGPVTIAVYDAGGGKVGDVSFPELPPYTGRAVVVETDFPPGTYTLAYVPQPVASEDAAGRWTLEVSERR